MPGAPNRPPEMAAPSPPPTVDAPERRVLRRLAPSRIALSLDVWRGAPSRELIEPLEKAEAAYGAREWREAESQLDRLAIRFHEPRWPTLPLPFRELRVPIPPPHPPQWDPEFRASPEEREAMKARKTGETQVALVIASIAWAKTKGIDVGGFETTAETARAAFASGGPVADLYAAIDPIWEALRAKVPLPKAAASRATAAAAPAPPEEA